MTVKLVVAVTDNQWFNQLRSLPNLSEVNFWSPSGIVFKALQPGELFLFKLHSPQNYIVGGGVFAYANTLPCSLAWEAFGAANGARSLSEMRARIVRYRRNAIEHTSDFQIGCRILTQPFFLEEHEWLSVPASFASNIVTFKTYAVDEGDGKALWEAIESRVYSYPQKVGMSDIDMPRFGSPSLVKPRLGQGAFRILITDIYNRRCAVTKEKTLPALEAAHIQPYGEGGNHEPSNGLLLRRDLHSLFDAGYVTVTPDMKFEVSRKIREDYENGRDYYAMHGRVIDVPVRNEQRPDPDLLRWHNSERFLA